MTTKGKHSSEGSGEFYRDLAMMIGGIILVGAAVFLVLFLLADNSESLVTTTDSSTTTTTVQVVVTTTVQTVTTTTPTPTTTTSTTVPVRSNGEVRVVVLNATQVSGAAGALTSDLDDAGYLTLPAEDYRPLPDPSRIWYRDSFSAEANELLQFVPNAIVEPLTVSGLAEGADVIIVLGTGFDG